MEQDLDITPSELDSIRKDLDLNESLQRLFKNRDFKKIIVDMYLKDGSVMLTKNLAKIKYNKEAKMDIINDNYIARSLLYSFFDDIENNAKDAKVALEDISEGE